MKLLVRSLVHYAVAGGILVVFGRQVCPFIACLSHGQLGRVVFLSLAVAWCSRMWAERRWVESAPMPGQALVQFRVEFGAFLLAAAAAALIDRVVHGFPLGSGFKLAMGFLTVGFAVSLDLALARERSVIRALNKDPSGHVSLTGRPLSVSRTFVGIAGAGILLGTVDIVLLSLHDLSMGESMMVTRRELVMELVFVAVVTGAYALAIIMAWSRNLGLLFSSQVRVLDDVAQGRLERVVPVATRNEFGFIADHTNRMIVGLRDRARVRHVLEKVFSPEVAEQLVETGGARFGTRRDLVLLFMDLRGFTAHAEEAEPERLVRDLNSYFSAMVAQVRRHGGVVDKFIGDGMLAIFGMDRRDGAEADAVRCALAMRNAVIDLKQDVKLPLEPGIGIHSGEVIAGVAGAETRLEFTVIGDAVNTASRLEGSTKSCGHSLLISARIMDALPPDLSSLPWTALGELALPGRKASLVAFGLK